MAILITAFVAGLVGFVIASLLAARRCARAVAQIWPDDE